MDPFVNKGLSKNVSFAGARTASLPGWGRIGLVFLISGGLTCLIAFVSGRPDVALIALVVAVLPTLASLGRTRPEVLAGLFVLAQPLEAFEVGTPVTTISVGNLLLAVLVLTNLSSIWLILRTSRVAQVAAALLLGWLFLYPLRAIHDPPGQVLRTTVTMASFVLVAAAGLAVARRPGILRAVAFGSVGALMVLAAVGILVNMGLAPMTLRTGGARDLFGFTSPFMRTYGLDVPFDAVSLLVPLSVPFLCVRAIDRETNLSSRAWSVVAVCLVGLASLLIFQGRGMLLQIAVSLAIAVVLAVPRRYRIGAALALGLLVVVVAVRLINADQLSSGLRGGIDLYAIRSVVADPARFILGVQENAFYSQAAAAIGLQEYAPADSVVHNFFLSTLIGGGLIAFALITAFHAVAVWAPFNRWRIAPTLNSRAMLVAVAVVMIGLSIEPARAGIVGSWLILGVAIGRGTSRDENSRWRLAEGKNAQETTASRNTLEPPDVAAGSVDPDPASSGEVSESDA